MVRFVDNGSAVSAVAITPNDSTDLAAITRGLFVGTGGNLSLILADDSSPVLFKNVPAGSVLPLRVKRVRAANTTAADILGLS